MRHLFAIVLTLASSTTWAQSEVYLCVNPETGEKRYRNTGETAGCKKIDLPGIAMLPAQPKQRPHFSFEKAKIGMSKQTVLKEVGKPQNMRKVETRAGLTETWTYPGGKSLTFSNGSLEMIEQ